MLKTIGIYDPNNTSKTCLIESLWILSGLMLGEHSESFYNSFFNDYVTKNRSYI